MPCHKRRLLKKNVQNINGFGKLRKWENRAIKWMLCCEGTTKAYEWSKIAINWNSEILLEAWLLWEPLWFVFLTTPILSQSLNNRASGLSWIIVLKDKNEKEHVMEMAHLSFKDMSVSIYWYGTSWPCLDVLSTLKLFGVIPLLPDQSTAPSKNGWVLMWDFCHFYCCYLLIMRL